LELQRNSPFSNFSVIPQSRQRQVTEWTGNGTVGNGGYGADARHGLIKRKGGNPSSLIEQTDSF